MGRKDDFGAWTTQFFQDYDTVAEHEETGPFTVANEEVGTLKKRCIKIWERNIEREVGRCLKL